MSVTLTVDFVGGASLGSGRDDDECARSDLSDNGDDSSGLRLPLVRTHRVAMGRLIRAIQTGKPGACIVVVLSLTACPSVGDPHIETGFRVGPIAEETEGDLLRAMCGTEVPARVLPKGSYLWGGPLPAAPEECRELGLCRTTWSSNVLTRSVVCGNDRYAYVFYTGLQAILKRESATICKALSDHSSRILFSERAEEDALRWWTEGPKGMSLGGLGCKGE